MPELCGAVRGDGEGAAELRDMLRYLEARTAREFDQVIAALEELYTELQASLSQVARWRSRVSGAAVRADRAWTAIDSDE